MPKNDDAMEQLLGTLVEPLFAGLAWAELIADIEALGQKGGVASNSCQAYGLPSRRAGKANRGQAFSGGSAAVLATWPTQTWPSVNRSAFQIGTRAFVSSIA